MPVILLKTRIHAPAALCFDLSRSVDMHIYSTQQSNEKIVKGVQSGLMELNDIVTWEAVHFGVKQRLTSIITQMDKYESFTDEMQKGIFKYMRHQHIFIDKGTYTIMKDVFEYQSPLGFLGRMADSLFVRSYMENLLIIRNTHIKKIAEEGSWSQFLDEKSYSFSEK